MDACELKLKGQVAFIVAEAVAFQGDAGDLVAEVFLCPVGGEAALGFGEGDHELVGAFECAFGVDEVEDIAGVAVELAKVGLEGGELCLNLFAGGVVFNVFAGGDEFDESLLGGDDEQEGVKCGIGLGSGVDLQDVTFGLNDGGLADGGDNLLLGFASVEAEGVGPGCGGLGDSAGWRRWCIGLGVEGGRSAEGQSDEGEARDAA